ncbi:MAG: phosphatidylserine/phosphatidylglycerophosphate/cardiolipin synthase family protein [Pseudomonadota bacterium]|nr:phosphatidylserine/phosphatidylglycerophosphate/cardiolipin synthase family protein [Pseudomonadota bacterium]
MLHLRLLARDPIGGAYVPLPDGARVRARGGLPGWVIDEAEVRGGVAALAIAETGALRLEVSLGGDAIDPVRGLRVPPGTPGSFTPPDPWCVHLGHRRPRGVEGTEGTPFVVRLGREAFLRFVWWCEPTGGFHPAPAGLVVRAWDANLLGDTVLAEAVTDGDGQVCLALAEDGEAAPDLYFTVERPPGADVGAGLSAAFRFQLPGRWTSREQAGVERTDQHGYWPDWDCQRLGTPEEPYVFALDETGPRRHPGNDVALLVDGPELLAAWGAAIASARETIHFEVMLYYDDPMTRRIQALLLEKARAGVKVRMLLGLNLTRSAPDYVLTAMAWALLFRRLEGAALDAELGALRTDHAAETARASIEGLLDELEAEPNVTVLDSSFSRVEVLPGILDELPGFGRVLPSAYRAMEDRLPWFTVARVDHRKLLLVDGRVAVLGGQNVGQEYAYERPFDPAVPDHTEEWRKWHDVSVRLEGPVVADLQHRFRERWVCEGGDAFAQGAVPNVPPVSRGLPVRIVDTTPGARRHYHATMLALFHGARREIRLMNPYFSSAEVLGALTAAARRGVDVTFVFPDAHNDSIDFRYAARLWYGELIEAGVAVYEYRNHMNHAKVALVDDVAVIGTANLNHSSLFHHYELAAVIDDAAFARRMRAALWERDLPVCRRIRVEDLPGLLDINAAGEMYLRRVVHKRF